MFKESLLNGWKGGILCVKSSDMVQLVIIEQQIWHILSHSVVDVFDAVEKSLHNFLVKVIRPAGRGRFREDSRINIGESVLG